MQVPKSPPAWHPAQFPAKFWYIEIRLEAKGVDLVHRSAVPVYKGDDRLR